jgi:cytochrome aa3-600 menaquinol oxidase subunit 2
MARRSPAPAGPRRRLRPFWAALGPATALLLTGCGRDYVLLHPQGPVAAQELHLLVLASLVMAVVIVFVFVLLAVAAIRFRERPHREAPYTPDRADDRRLEVLWFVVPVAMLAVIALPTVGETYSLAHLPPRQDPVVVDVTSLSWKWLFEYPGQHVATVNYLVMPAGEPVLFELTADSAMNAFWVPALGGMEYTMPGEVLPLWLEADRPGTYWGHSGQFSGLGFARMFFQVRAVPAARFAAWAARVRRTAPPMTAAAYRQLQAFGTMGQRTYSSYPPSSFPALAHGFGLAGGDYVRVTGGGTAPMAMGFLAPPAARTPAGHA